MTVIWHKLIIFAKLKPEVAVISKDNGFYRYTHNAYTYTDES